MRHRAEPNGEQIPAALTRARIDADITKTELGRLLGVARSTVHAYETGARRPSRERLVSIARALKFSAAATNELLAVAGSEPEPEEPVRTMERRQKTVTQAAEQIAQLPWVALVANELNEIMGWNGLSVEVSQIDFANETPQGEERNFASLAAMPHFRERLENWHELIGRLLAQWKTNEGDILAADGGYFAALLQRIGTRYPAALSDLINLWFTVEAAPTLETGIRNIHPARWRLPDGTLLSFTIVVRPWDDFDALFCYDWHAADAATAEWVKARSAALGSVGRLLSASEYKAGPWSETLVRIRQRAGMTQDRLSRESGISVSSIQSYETGRRTPSRTKVIAFCEAAQSDSASANAVLRWLGMESLPSDYALWLTGEVRPRGPAYRIAAPGLLGMRRQIDALTWPCLVFDASCRLVLRNRPAARLGEDRLRPVSRPHLLDVLCDAYLAGSILNVDQVFARLVPEAVRQVLNPSYSGRTDRGALAHAARALAERSPDLASKLSSLWSESRTREVTRPVARLDWRTTGGESLVFDVVAARWSDASPMWALDFHPATAETWQWVERSR